MKKSIYFCLFHSENIEEAECIVLDCGESICRKCLFQHVKTIIDSGNSIFLCPHRCKPEITPIIIEQIVSQNPIYAKKFSNC